MVGGDWYDVVPLPDGGVGLLMGDVAGRGVAAAALMGQLRIAVRAYALEDPSPRYVLGRLNRLLATLGEDSMATAIYGLLEPGGWNLKLAAAAHMPPVVVAPDGAVERLDDIRGLPLGAVPTAEFPETCVALEPGSAVLFYTDGLVERRGESLRVGLDRLVDAIAPDPDAGVVCDRIVDDLLPGGATADDAALLLMQTRRLAADALRLRLPAEPATLGAMRSALRRWLAAMGVDERAAYRIVLAANEAAANAIEHAYAATTAEFEVTAAREHGAVVVSVRDWGRWRAPRDEHRGRGLQLMEAMMDEVRVERQADGTTVWLRRATRQAPAR